MLSLGLKCALPIYLAYHDEVVYLENLPMVY